MAKIRPYAIWMVRYGSKTQGSTASSAAIGTAQITIQRGDRVAVGRRAMALT